MCNDYFVSLNLENIMGTKAHTFKLVVAGITLIGADDRKPW
jgi:hypothetical protein